MGITMQECDLTCLKHQSVHIKYKGRVRAVASGTPSLWAESPKYLDYLFDVEPAPPTLTWIRNKETLSINATYELPPCVGPMNLKYEVEFWKEGSPNKTSSQATLHGTEMKIRLPSNSTGCYCLSARTLYLLITPKYSNFSQPSCFLLDTPGTQLRMQALLLLFFLAVIIFLSWMCCLKNIYFQQAKMPLSLDFSGFTCPVKTLNLNEQESSNLSICPKNNLRQGRRPYTGFRSPGIPQPSEVEGHEPEDKSEEEESEDDSGTFEPYLGVAPLKDLLTGTKEAERHTHSLQSAGSLTHHPGSDFSPVMDTSDSGNVSDSFWGESDSMSCLMDADLGGAHLSLPSPTFLKESKVVKDLSEDSLYSRDSLEPSSPELVILPEVPLVSLNSLIIIMDRGAQDGSKEERDCFMEGEEEEEEEEEMVDGNEVEGLWSEYPKRSKVTDYQHIPYRLR
ncbi:interferon lambda receptor 1 isoform X2 [Sminthopsis crassicaudata]